MKMFVDIWDWVINRGRFDFYVLVAVDLISPKYYSHLHRHKVMLIYDVRAFILHQ